MTQEEKISKDPLKRFRGSDLKSLNVYRTPDELKQMRITTVCANEVLSQILFNIKSKQQSNKKYTPEELLNEKK